MVLVYHITHVTHLASIATDGLLCDRLSEAVAKVNIAHSNIKARRRQTAVPCAARGSLAHYVPFYFGPRSPMLYSIHTGYVDGYDGGQREIVHLVANAEEVATSGIQCAYTDGHAVVELSEFFEDIVAIPEHVDLPLMGETWWNDTQLDPDRKRRRQAEFLAYEAVPWEMIEFIGVIDEPMRQTVVTTLEGVSDHAPKIGVRPDWYY